MKKTPVRKFILVFVKDGKGYIIHSPRWESLTPDILWCISGCVYDEMESLGLNTNHITKEYVLNEKA